MGMTGGGMGSSSMSQAPATAPAGIERVTTLCASQMAGFPNAICCGTLPPVIIANRISSTTPIPTMAAP